MSNSTGIIVARMQVPYLTDGHRLLLDTALKNHTHVLVFLGVSKYTDVKNPLSYDMRRQMIKDTYPRECIDGKLEITYIPDVPDDKTWVAYLESRIHVAAHAKGKITLYGGRDSFIECYKAHSGIYETQYVDTVDGVSGTILRKQCSISKPEYSSEIAHAIIWAVNQVKNE